MAILLAANAPITLSFMGYKQEYCRNNRKDKEHFISCHLMKAFSLPVGCVWYCIEERVIKLVK
jgi:hypothetical protein